MSAPQPGPQPPSGPQSSGTQPPAEPGTRPEDVGTGFGLWLTALVLLTVGSIVDVVAAPAVPPVIKVIGVFFLLVLAAVVLTFLMLLRGGYQLARTGLTAGGLASIVSTLISLFAGQREPAAAVVYALTGILGVVLIAGGIFLLHRKDAHAYFTR